MKGNKLFDLIETIGEETKKNSPMILTGLAIVGLISTAYLSYKAGIKADKIIEKYKKDIKSHAPSCEEDKENKKNITIETAKKMVPVIAPPIIMGGVTLACIIGSHSVSNRKIAALSAAYSLSESTVKNLNGKMEEMLGEKKTRSIRDSIMKDKLEKDSEKDKKLMDNGSIIIPNDGTVLCKDLYSGRLFYSTAEKINQAIAKCSYDLISDMYVSLNDFYDAIDSPQLKPIPMGNDLGWNVDDSQNGKLPIYLTALLTEDNKPCLCVEYDISVRKSWMGC